MSARKSVFSNLGATCLPRGSSICPEEPHGLPTSENHTHPSSLAPHKRLPHTQVPEPCLDPWVLGEASGPAGPWLWGYWGLSEGLWPPPPPPRQRGLGTRLEIKKSKTGGRGGPLSSSRLPITFVTNLDNPLPPRPCLRTWKWNSRELPVEEGLIQPRFPRGSFAHAHFY